MNIDRHEFKSASRLPRKQARKVGVHLGKLEKRRNALTPKIVLEDARSKSSPLHKLFEWDDSIAAERHRLSQAGLILRSITVIYSDMTPKSNLAIRGYVNVYSTPKEFESDGIERKYITTSRAMSDTGYRKQVIDRALTEATLWRNRYSLYKELGEIVTAIDRAVRGNRVRKTA